MVKFEIRQIDAWAEAEGGWTWNNSIKVGEFQTRAADQKRAFLYALHKLGIVCKRGRMTVIFMNCKIGAQMNRFLPLFLVK